MIVVAAAHDDGSTGSLLVCSESVNEFFTETVCECCVSRWTRAVFMLLCSESVDDAAKFRSVHEPSWIPLLWPNWLNKGCTLAPSMSLFPLTLFCACRHDESHWGCLTVQHTRASFQVTRWQPNSRTIHHRDNNTVATTALQQHSTWWLMTLISPLLVSTSSFHILNNRRANPSRSSTKHSLPIYCGPCRQCQSECHCMLLVLFSSATTTNDVLSAAFFQCASLMAVMNKNGAALDEHLATVDRLAPNFVAFLLESGELNRRIGTRLLVGRKVLMAIRDKHQQLIMQLLHITPRNE